MLKRKIILTAVLLLLAGGFIIFQLVRGSPALVIENRSGQGVRELEVRAGEQKETFRNIKKGADRPVLLKVREGDVIILRGELDNGDVVRGQLRVSGRNLRALIRPGGLIEFRSGGK